jgi:hypothetical protein
VNLSRFCASIENARLEHSGGKSPNFVSCNMRKTHDSRQIVGNYTVKISSFTLER